MHINDVVLVSLLLTLNRFQTLLWCFRCWLWTSKCTLRRSSVFVNSKVYCLLLELNAIWHLFTTECSETLRIATSKKMFWLLRDHPFSTYAKFSEKLTFLTPLIRTRMCAYQDVNVSFSENFAYVLNGWSRYSFFCQWFLKRENSRRY